MYKIFFQIGINNGNYLFRNLVEQNNSDMVILVKPNINLINEI
jgi:hypothetical protein